MNALSTRSAFRFAFFALGFALGASRLQAQPTRFDLGYLDDPSYYRTTIQPGRRADYWFHLRGPGMTLRVNVQDFNGRGIEAATLFDAAGGVKAQSLGTLGASIGASNLAAGWHHLLVTTRNS